jgi:hypothetical protein
LNKIFQQPIYIIVPTENEKLIILRLAVFFLKPSFSDYRGRQIKKSKVRCSILMKFEKKKTFKEILAVMH